MFLIRLEASNFPTLLPPSMGKPGPEINRMKTSGNIRISITDIRERSNTDHFESFFSLFFFFLGCHVICTSLVLLKGNLKKLIREINES